MANHSNLLYLCLSTLLFYVAYALIEQDKPIYGSHQLITYVVDWDIPKVIPWEKLDHIAYAFAIPDARGELSLFDEAQLEKIVEEAHNHGKGVSLAIGGWTGSIYFSSIVRNSQGRKRFADILVNTVDKYNLNGLNIDWEYPNDPAGISCNRKHPKDTENFLELVKLLREMLDKKYPKERKLITAAVSANVFMDEDHHPLERLEEAWSTDMDAFYIMAYDINGEHSDSTAPNAPLHLAETGQRVSVDSSIKSWIKAGVPAERIYLGVPFYGYTQKTKKPITPETGMNVLLNRDIPQIKGDEHDDFAKEPCPGSKPTFSGEFQWRTIEESGAAYNSSGWFTFWDQQTSTPYAYKEENSQFITFDNPSSLRIKSEYVRENKLGGIMLWSLEMDDEANSLLNAIQDVRT